MRPDTKEWVSKAEGDVHTARRELHAKKMPNFDASCYHAQQCVEKYFEARLTEAGEHAPKIHDLEALLDRLLHIEPGWEELRESLQRLTEMAVEVRYPGFTADGDDAREAVSTAEKARGQVRRSLSLDKQSFRMEFIVFSL